MAVARIIESGMSAAEYDQLMAALGISNTPPPGGLFHIAMVGEDGDIRITEIWESREEVETWRAKVAAARTEAGLRDHPVVDRILEVHNIVQW